MILDAAYWAEDENMDLIMVMAYFEIEVIIIHGLIHRILIMVFVQNIILPVQFMIYGMVLEKGCPILSWF